MRRRGEHERINANFRRQGLHQFNVRGILKAKAVSLLHALANNIMAAPASGPTPRDSHALSVHHTAPRASIDHKLSG